MADLAELLQKQGDAARLAVEMAGEQDPQRRQEIAGQLEKRCAELERMAKALAAASAAEAGGAETRVVLTPEQRQRVAEQTGVGVEVVTLRDTAERAWSRQMPQVEPREIEAMAARQAAATRLRTETRKQVEQIIRELEKLEVPELAETLAALRRDVVR